MHICYLCCSSIAPSVVSLAICWRYAEGCWNYLGAYGGMLPNFVRLTAGLRLTCPRWRGMRGGTDRPGPPIFLLRWASSIPGHSNNTVHVVVHHHEHFQWFDSFLNARALLGRVPCPALPFPDKLDFGSSDASWSWHHWHGAPQDTWLLIIDSTRRQERFYHSSATHFSYQTVHLSSPQFQITPDNCLSNQ